MTAREYIEKNGDVEFSFTNSYKYTFEYDSPEGHILRVGGCPDEIYRVNFNAKTWLSEWLDWVDDEDDYSEFIPKKTTTGE